MKKFAFLLAAIIALCFNLLPSHKLFGGNSITYVSNNFTSTIITPAGFAFSIWGIIFLSLLIIGISNIKNPELISKTVLHNFFGSVAAICLWVVFFQKQIPFLPVILLFTILYFNVKVSLSFESNAKHFYHIYTSWTLIASILNVVILLQYDLGIKSLFTIPNPILAIVLLAVGVLLYCFLANKFNSITPVLVGAWAYFGISKVTNLIQPNQDIKTSASIYALLMLIMAGYIVYKNRKLLSFKNALL